MDKIYLSQKKLDELIKEREHLIQVVRPEYKEELSAARAQGDLSENADYDAARDKQARVEARISELSAILKNYDIIENTKSSVVKIGSSVVVEDLEENTQNTYSIVGSIEADPLNGKLSNASPLAQAILDRKEGEIVTVNVDHPYQVKIIKIKINKNN